MQVHNQDARKCRVDVSGIEGNILGRSFEMSDLQDRRSRGFRHHGCDSEVAIIRWFGALGGEVCLDGLPGLVAVFCVLSVFGSSDGEIGPYR